MRGVIQRRAKLEMVEYTDTILIYLTEYAPQRKPETGKYFAYGDRKIT